MYNFRHNSKTIYNINSEIPPHRIQTRLYNFVKIDFIIDFHISCHVKLKDTMLFFFLWLMWDIYISDGGDISEKKTWFRCLHCLPFFVMIATFITHTRHQNKHFNLYIYIFSWINQILPSYEMKKKTLLIFISNSFCKK